MSEKKPKNAIWSFFGNPISWGFFLTVILGVVVTILAVSAGPSGIVRFLEFGTLESNEIGDTLAGIFAPLAFIWIVVTVFLQNQELTEQRRELAMTREELMLARVAQEKQLEVMQSQINIFDDERKSRAEERAAATMHSHLKRLILFFVEEVGSDVNTLLLFGLESYRKKSYPSGASQLADAAALEHYLQSSRNLPDFFEKFVPLLKKSWESDIAKNPRWQPGEETFEFLRRLSIDLAAALAVRENLSDALKVDANTMRLCEFMELLQNFQNQLRSPPPSLASEP